MKGVFAFATGFCVVVGVGNMTQSKGWMTVTVLALVFIAWVSRKKN